MIIRAEEPSDYPAIRALLTRVFGRLDEARLVEDLRRDGDCVLSGVAESGGAIVGHVACSRMAAPFPALGLGPVATAATHRRAGVASALIRWGLEGAERDGWRAVFVLGDPGFYRRFGFEATRAARFSSPYAGPHFMALTIGGAFPLRGGRIDYAPAFGRLG